MRRAGWLIASIAALVFSFGLFGNWNDTSTGIDLDNLPRFPLTKIRSGFLKDGVRAEFDGITATSGGERREVRLRGVGKSGKRWEVHLATLDEVWRGDLDRNGTQDYVLFASGPFFNGRTTPVFSLSILLMDRDGMPVPFFTVVYQGEHGEGIKHLVDMNRDGRAEILISSYDENPSDPYAGPFCSGHWVNQLYEFRNLAAEEIRGNVGGIRFPLVHDWTDAKCFKLESPFGAAELAEVRDHGTNRALMRTKITNAIDGNRLEIEPVEGCRTIRPNVIVYEQRQTREVGFVSLFSEYQLELAQRMQRDGARVTLRGVNKDDDGFCAVNLAWAE